MNDRKLGKEKKHAQKTNIPKEPKACVNIVKYFFRNASSRRKSLKDKPEGNKSGKFIKALELLKAK